MKKNMKIAIPVMAAVLVLLIVLRATGLMEFNSGVKLGFAGNSTFHKYNGTYLKITGHFSHDLRPSKDSDSIHCEITTESGDLHVEIVQKDDGKILCDKLISGDETFDLKAEGKVRVNLETEGHEGSYRFSY
ncbi:MAG: hypothetical protein K6E85_05590 [Lachnospiraceae bacterium]|nr:hypothetical protein [Lachnospiraceae bacterium]